MLLQVLYSHATWFVQFFFSQDILPKKLKLMDEIKEQEDGETDEKERNESADMYQHITEDVKE